MDPQKPQFPILDPSREDRLGIGARPPRRSGPRIGRRGLLALLGFGILLALTLLYRSCRHEPPPPAPPEEEVPMPPPSQLDVIRYPTEQQDLLLPPRADVFQPTVSGRVESGTYGSVRTGSDGHAKFHEGIDIAPLQRDARGRAQDTVHAVADGRVAYCNRGAGASNYGKYVVLLHEDPVGEVYTLYAHLQEVDDALRKSQRVQRGQRLGIMGNTSSFRSRFEPHVHFEIGLITNAHFKKLIDSPHGIYNGLNLYGLSPLRFFAAHREHATYSMAAHLRTEPVAFRITVRAKARPDYFARYPSLWTGEAYAGLALTLDVADVGTPLAGRNATPEETRALGRSAHRVFDVNPDALGRNGRGLIAQDGEGWDLGRYGSTWLQRLTFLP